MSVTCVCMYASLVSLLVWCWLRCTVYPLFEQKRCVLFLRVMCCYYSAVLVVFAVVGISVAAAVITISPLPNKPLISTVRFSFTHSGYFKTITETQTNINCSRHVHTQRHNYCPLYTKCCFSVCRFLLSLPFSSSFWLLFFFRSSTFDLERNLFCVHFCCWKVQVQNEMRTGHHHHNHQILTL